MTGERPRLASVAVKDGKVSAVLPDSAYPGMDPEKIFDAVTAEFLNKIITVHIRYDDGRCIGAVREAIRLSRENGFRRRTWAV